MDTLILANMGTPLMWSGALQLLGGNVLIALLESWIIVKWFRPQRKKWSVFLIMVLANYFSALVGLVASHILGSFVLDRLAGEDALYVLRWIFIPLFFGSYLITLLLEWPFCLWALGKREDRLRGSVGAVLASQTVSYVAMLPLLLMASGFSLITSAHPDPSFVPGAPDIATIYYISPDGDSLCKVRLNGTGRQKVKDVSSQGLRGNSDLFLARRARESSWDIFMDNGRDYRIVLEKVTVAGPLAWLIGTDTQQVEQGGPPNFKAAVLPSNPDPIWQVKAGPWSPGALSAKNQKTGETIYISLDTPVAQWRSRAPSLLPGDMVVYQLENQIVLLDLNSKRIGLIAMGWSPVVVLDDKAVPASAPQKAS